MKTFSTLKLENSLKKIPTIKIQEDINDVPRKVTNFHFCRSQPKVRNNPQLYGLSKKAVELIGINYEEEKKNKVSAQFLSGSKLMDGSEVYVCIFRFLPITIADINLEIGLDSWVMEELTFLELLLIMKTKNMSCNLKEAGWHLFLGLLMGTV